MNARLVKETRDLLPMFAGTLPLIVAPYLIWHGSAGEFGYVAFGLACAVLGGWSFGNEFQHRTLTLLLSQPVSRSALWRDKMLVLGAGIVASLAASAVCIGVYCPGLNLAFLLLIGLCAFCGTPCWTLLLRQGIGGMAVATAAPVCMLGFYRLATDRLPIAMPVREGLTAVLILLYCAAVYWWGHDLFKRLEATDGPASRELNLPAGLEAVCARPLVKVSSRFRGAFASLLKKELRLQQVSLVLAGLFAIIAAIGFGLIPLYPGLGLGTVGGDFGFYMIILPLAAGAISVAEEKGWDVAEWHLTLPPSALKQWSAKMLAALSTSLTLGLALPTAMFMAGRALLRQPGAGPSLPPTAQILGWILGFLLLTSVAVYTASFSRNTLRAILAAFGISVASFGVFFLMGTCVDKFIRWRALTHGFPRPQEELALASLDVGLFLLLCLTQGLAWSNFRRSAPPVRRIVIQLLTLFFAVGLVSLAICAAALVVEVSGQ